MALSSNPAFSNSPAFNGRGDVAARVNAPSAEELDQLYSRPSATPVDTQRMTYEDTIVKTVSLFAVLLATAAVGWFIPGLFIVGMIGGLILGLVNTFKRQPSVPLIVGYAAFEGLFVGGISALFEGIWPGVVVQAVIATLVTVAAVLALFASGKVRASARATKIFLVAMVAYLLFSLVNLGLMLFNAPVAGGAFGLNSMEIIPGVPLGLIIGALAVLLASYSLVLDFDFVKRGVQTGLPQKFGWQAGFGIMVTVVWLYVEFLRIFAILRGSE
ncbi:Bax inhibitor-1/YccA family protein [Naasia sp. SYSU D00948]|uniref:Bax inhibitor-1/YccA family protein n=1 Tax=Naasia sp. SYSU D00948 TaxID=2817379 RepID=UPI001B30C04B|nr:Bax inhibitor-1/YccA family protein [Naasia sp. SYSU D00948]